MLSFDGPTKRITLSSGTTELDVQDLWSRWIDWLLTSDNSKYAVAMRTVGGDDIDVSAGTRIPVYTYMLNGWKVVPQSADHVLYVSGGILLVDGGGDPFESPAGAYNTRIVYQQPVQAVSYAEQAAGDLTWLSEIEDGMTAKDLMRIFAAVLAGRSAGGGSARVRFKALSEDKDRVDATMDSNGNRTSVTLDAT